MLKSNPLYCFIFFYFIFIFSVFAQKNIHELQIINVKEGLPNSSTHNILQDKNNFIWISTPGSLLKYDGYNFKNFNASFFNINEGSALSLALDKNNLIWFCERLAFIESPQSGVFNPETETITTFENFTNGLFKSSDIISLNASKKEKNTIYISTKQGVIYKYKNDFEEIYRFTDPKTYRIYVEGDANGNYWITHNNGEIIKVNSEKQAIENYNINIGYFVIEKTTILENEVVFEGYDNTLKKDYWQIKNQKLQRLKTSMKNNFQILYTQNSEMFFIRNDVVYKRKIIDNIDEDVLETDEKITEIPNISCNSSFIDQQGVLWITSSNGLYKIVTKKNPFTVYQTENSIRGIYANDHKLWIGGYTKNSSTNLTTNQQTEINLDNRTITSFIQYEDNFIWLGTNVHTLYKYNINNNNYTAYSGNSIDALLLPYQNPTTKKIWIGSSNGLYYLNDKDEITHYYYKDLEKAYVRQFLYTDEGIWVVSNRGLFLMDSKTEKIIKRFSKSENFPVNNINHIHKDTKDIYWLATKNEGLIRWNFKENTFKKFSKQDGLSNNTIYAVYEDEYKKLWLPSNYGLMRFDKITNDTQVFTTKDGIANNEFNTFAHFKNTDGTFYFGSINGLISFHPKNFIDKNSEEISIYISDIKVIEKNAEEFENRSLKPSLKNPILLNYDDRILEIEVSLLDFKSIGNHQYAYKIDGYDTQWLYTRTNKISIFNFPYGNHIIRVKAKGDSDLWTANELEIPIIVNKPFYLKWQFIALFFSAILLFVYLYLKLRIKKLNKAKLALEKEVSVRTQQIEKDKKIIEIQAEDLKALDVAKSRFFANLTHEFRTPLTLIIGPLEQIIDAPPPSATLKRRATGILNNAKHILALINQLLDLAKLESKQMPIEVVNTDIVLHTNELVKRFNPLVFNKNQQLTFKSSETKWVINFDNDKWDKIIYNLLSNAIKFTPENKKIEVVLNKFTENGETFIKLQVIDEGIGIDEQSKKYIFDRFYQVDLSSTRANEGTGIGLSLVMELIKLQNGSISVSNKNDEGTIFTIILPLHKNSIPKLYTSNKQNEYLISGLKNSKNTEILAPESDHKLDVLVIDDNEEIREYIAQCLGQKIYNISFAKDGEIGLEKALSIIPDMIISDVMMPKKDGFELLTAIRNHVSTSHIPFILLTAKSTLDSKIKGLKHGADAYLTKPFNPKELEIRVQKLIEIRQVLQNRYNQNLKTSDTTFEKEDTFILDLKAYIRANLNKKDLNGDTIGLNFGLSRIHLYRKLKALTNASISEFVKDIRLERGMELIIEKTLNISEIAYEIGFTSPSHFSRSFKDKFGKSPSQM